jgi:hypothetical protein
MEQRELYACGRRKNGNAGRAGRALKDSRRTSVIERAVRSSMNFVSFHVC